MRAQALPSPMRLDRFDLNLLVVLDALLDERSVTRAAQRLHIGQSAASGALARLREFFGDELLLPVGRQLTLTPLAASLVEPVRDTLHSARAAIARKPGFDAATAARRFTVCASDYVTTVLLADAVRRIAAQAPGVAIDIRSPPRHVVDVFERGDVDLLVMPRQYVARLAHPQAELFEDTQVCVVWAEHPTLGTGADIGDGKRDGDHRPTTLSFARYMALGHVAVRFGDERSIAFEEWFLPRHEQPRRIESSVDNFSALPLLVVGTERIATLHRRLAAHFAAYLPLRLIEPPFEMPPLVEMMAWPRHLDADPAHAWLRGLLAGCAAGMAA